MDGKLSTMLAFILLLASFQVQGNQIHPEQSITDVEHQTSLGKLIGQSVTNKFTNDTENTFYAFKKLPYAIPPTGERRWTDPEIQESSWEGAYDAREFGPVCVQEDWPLESFTGDEDCLHLNIYTPKLIRPDSPDQSLLPVMFYLHGGGYQDGSGKDYLPDKLIRDNVVIVTINYRLNMFGFLSTNDQTLPGNYGLLDQVTALKWVKNHIRDFGGDPNLITIFGQSAGGASVHSIVLSPLAKGLFQHAIIQGGAAICDWGTTNKAKEDIKTVATAAGCLPDPNNIESAVSCLRSRPAKDLMNDYIGAQKKRILFTTFFAPVVDDSRPNPFFPEKPKVLLKKGNYSQVPMIIGITEEEGALFAGFIDLHINETWSDMVNDRDQLKRLLMPELFEEVTETKDASTNERNIDMIHAKYFNDVGNDDEKALRAVADMIGDRMIVSCLTDTIKLHKSTSKSPVYSYLFTYKNRPSFLNYVMRTIESENKPIPEFYKKAGATHFDDAVYLFKLSTDFDSIKDFESVNITGRSKEADMMSQEEMTKKMTNIWTAFAKTGSLRDSVVENSWEPVTSDASVKWFVLDELVKPMVTDFRKEFVDFWKSLEPTEEQ